MQKLPLQQITNSLNLNITMKNKPYPAKILMSFHPTMISGPATCMQNDHFRLTRQVVTLQFTICFVR